MKKIVVISSSVFPIKSIRETLSLIFKDYSVTEITTDQSLEIVTKKAIAAEPDLVIFIEERKGTCNRCKTQINTHFMRYERTIEYIAKPCADSRRAQDLDPEITPISDVAELIELFLQKKTA